MADSSSQRHLFDIPRDVAYFNCSYNAPMLKSSAAVLERGARSKLHPWERGPGDFFDDAEAFRSSAARLLGGSPDQYAVVPSASYGTSTAARVLEDGSVTSDGEILVLDEAFPSNYLPWLRLSQVTGADFVVVSTPQDMDWTSVVLDRITERTQVVAVPNCHWTNGARLDLESIGAEARRVGAFLVLDATQSLGATPLDLETVRPDFMIAAGYKWLLCPYGVSLLYVDPKWHNGRPLEETWLSRAGAERFERLVEYTDEYQAGARRFEMGQKNIPSLLPGAVDALEQLNVWGVEAIAERTGQINRRLAELLAARGFAVVPEELRIPNILGARMPDGAPDDLLARLMADSVYISRRGASLRFAPHLHVDDHDIDHLIDAIDRNLKG